jgi:hypothetical protein
MFLRIIPSFIPCSLEIKSTETPSADRGYLHLFRSFTPWVEVEILLASFDKDAKSAAIDPVVLYPRAMDA